MPRTHRLQTRVRVRRKTPRLQYVLPSLTHSVNSIVKHPSELEARLNSSLDTTYAKAVEETKHSPINEIRARQAANRGTLRGKYRLKDLKKRLEMES